MQAARENAEKKLEKLRTAIKVMIAAVSLQLKVFAADLFFVCVIISFLL